MEAWVWDEAMASYTELVFQPQVNAIVTREDSYGSGTNQSKAVKLTKGVGKNGKIRVTVMNNVSGHDLYHDGMTDAAYESAINQRVKSDRVRVSIRYPDGSTEVLKDGVQSKVVTSVEVSATLKPGSNTIFVDRTDASGRVVGSANALAGRGVEIQWNGK